MGAVLNESLLPALRGLDTALFHKINQVWTHPLLDWAMPLLTDLFHYKAVTYGALPAVLVWWVYKKRAQAVRTLIGLALAVGLADMGGHRLIKPYFKRLRPERAGVELVLRTRSHGGYSFPSNHALNCFAGARFFAMVHPGLSLPLYGGAAVVAYSRVYTGVHFPFDVTAGGLLGVLAGWLVGWLFIGLGFSGPGRKRPKKRA
mgnify:CR=1 FL=1